MSPFKSSTGLPENLAATLCYFFPMVGGILFLSLEKRSRYVIFHALQSLLAFGILAAAHLLSSAVPIIGLLASALLALVGVLMWLVLMANAIQGKWFKLPWIGNIAEKQMQRV
ncbi:DUF4870 domain-containing protein [Paenibacillus sp. MDMC362]|uniref:DUF4870 domain-containing protein n=1 Tax=Paenibacillus sp. MDMC362 TaxID=2977365 RepID=UPI000DC23491|nr:hypothetical protein [Paenibacillus sp. MDMC362]RAR44026.1 hypothetical protein DP091_09965 [Paenibacillus sp. MDMC362]